MKAPLQYLNSASFCMTGRHYNTPSKTDIPLEDSPRRGPGKRTLSSRPCITVEAQKKGKGPMEEFLDFIANLSPKLCVSPQRLSVRTQLLKQNHDPTTPYNFIWILAIPSVKPCIWGVSTARNSTENFQSMPMAQEGPPVWGQRSILLDFALFRVQGLGFTCPFRNPGGRHWLM